MQRKIGWKEVSVLLTVFLGNHVVADDSADFYPQLAKQFIGAWQVSLYFSPTAKPSTTTMMISAVNEDGTLDGNFYGTPFDSARYTFKDEYLIFSVMTSDNSGVYSTSGRMTMNGKIEGQTLSVGRGFLMAWSAIK
ncbi:hypothetical protein [Aestuariibacter salexigens]|uniref:hypothetical protein n=1 Tax=Aestuariibacter salexigens TaxID=226010 RepID=UPI0003FB49A1|nr:hypothetical protein [Aestuariibacter salexigens]